MSQNQGGNKQTVYQYDSRNRLTKRTDPLGAFETYGYDATGNLTSHTDRNGNPNTYTPDALNRLSQVTYNTPGPTLQSTINYTYDAGNRVTCAKDSIQYNAGQQVSCGGSTTGTVYRQYDGLNDLTQEVTPQGTANYTYDNAGRRQTMQVVGQSQLVYSWDNANRFNGYTIGSNAVGISYDKANRLTCAGYQSNPYGTSATFLYDGDSHVTQVGEYDGPMEPCPNPHDRVGTLSYTYDANGRRTTLGGTLAAISLPSNVSGGSGTAYNSDNEQTAFNGTSFSYDANGNIKNDGAHTYTWDARNHLTGITGAVTATFIYDAFGRRASKTISGTTTQFLYDFLNPIQELNGSNGVTANLLTGGLDEYFARTDSSGTALFLPDALGSTAGLSVNSNSITTSYTYQPFGATTASGSSNANSYQFSGRENDGTGLYYYRARYYSPTYQRFIAQDPFAAIASSANPYAYGANSPQSLTDPFGLTVLFGGVGGGFDFLGFLGAYGSISLAVDANGNIAILLNGGFGAGAGAAEYAGITVGWSPNAQCVSEMGGPFGNQIFGAGYGLDMNVGAFEGKNPSGGVPIVGTDLTVGEGLGLGGSIGGSKTHVIRLGNLFNLFQTFDQSGLAGLLQVPILQTHQ